MRGQTPQQIKVGCLGPCGPSGSATYAWRSCIHSSSHQCFWKWCVAILWWPHSLKIYWINTLYHFDSFALCGNFRCNYTNAFAKETDGQKYIWDLQLKARWKFKSFCFHIFLLSISFSIKQLRKYKYRIYSSITRKILYGILIKN